MANAPVRVRAATKNSGVQGLGDADVADLAGLLLEFVVLPGPAGRTASPAGPPKTLKRSVMVLFIWAFRPYDSRVISGSRRPTRWPGARRRAGWRAPSKVIGHDRVNITIRTRPTLIRLETTDRDGVGEGRLGPDDVGVQPAHRDPVWVRVKNASGICRTWAKTSSAGRR